MQPFQALGIRSGAKLCTLLILVKLTLRSSFPIFPDGMPGVGLLLLRLTVGIVLASSGITQLIAWQHASGFAVIAAMLASICGVLFLFGLFNRIVCTLCALTSVGIALALIPVPGLNDSSVRMPAVFTAVMTIALLCLGPGAFSLDARRHGRREIIIPARPRPSDDDSL